MKNLLRRIVLCLGLLLPVAAMALPQVELIDRGKCGDNAEWSFYSIPGENNDYLFVSGVGPMYDNLQVKPWAKYVDRITYVSIQGAITHVGSYAFKDHKNLAVVYMWSKVNSIGEHAFENCTALKRATISDVAEVGDRAFNGCTSLSVLKNNSAKLTKVGERAFAGTALTSVDLSNVTQMGDAAFNNCMQLTSLTLPKKLTTLPHYSFSYSRKLKGVTIPEGYTTIGKEAFKGSGLESVSIPASVTNIRQGAFDECTALKSVTFEGTAVPEFEEYDVFGKNAEGRKLYIQPGSRLSSKPFLDTYASAFATSGACSSTINYSLENKVLTLTGSGAIPDYDNEGQRPWDGFKYAIDKVVIGDGITIVGKKAFTGMNVNTVTLPNSLTAIGESAFEHCRSLSNISFPDGLQVIEKLAFNFCRALNGDKTIPASVTYIGSQAFYSCFHIKHLVFKGATLPGLGWGAFDDNDSSLFIVPAGYTFDKEDNWRPNYKERFIVIGKCGEESEFTYYVDNGQLRITGKGAIGDYTELTQPWAPYKKDITQIDIREGITSIGSHAFAGFSDVTEVNIAGEVTTIGDHAFYNCSSLDEINYVKDLKTIGDYAFGGCTVLPNVHIANGVTSIGEGAFKNCTNLASVVLDHEVLPTLGNNAFDNNASQRKFYVNAGYGYSDESTWTDAYKSDIIVRGNNYTYNYNTSTKTLTISGNGPMADYTTQTMPWKAHKEAEHLVIEAKIESVGNYAFYEFNKLKDVVLPTTIRSIGTAAFGYCRALTTVGLSDELQIIGVNAFIGDESLTGVTIPSQVTVIDNGAFESCSQLVKVDFESVILPTLGNTAFDKNHSQRKFYVKTGYGFTDESTWTDAYKDAFMVKTNTGILYHYDSATKTLTFSGTGEMEDYTNDSQPWKDYSADIEKVVIGEGITKIGNYTLWSCENLTSVTIPSTVTNIGLSAFAYCKKLPAVTLPDGLTNIDFGAFYHCDALTEVTIPGAVDEINRQAFGACQALAKVTFDGTTLPVLTGSNAFDDNSLKRRFYVKSGYGFSDESTWTADYKDAIMIKTSTGVTYNYDEQYCVLTIGGEGAMADFNYGEEYPWKAYRDKAEEIIVEDGVTSIGKNAFYGFEKLTYVIIEGGVTSIGENAFAQCKAMLDITLPETLTTIGDRAFEHCENLSEITLPSTITNIGYNVFWYCPGITDVYCKADPEDLTWKVSSEGDESFMADKATMCHVLLGTIEGWTEKFGDVNVTFLADQRNGMTGTGTEEDPYLLVSADDMRWMATKFNSADEADRATVEGKYFKLVSDIDFNGMEESNYTPVKSFKGHFDGDGYMIYGVNVSVDDDSNAALIDKLEDGSSVKNIVLDYSNFYGAVAAPIVCQMYGTASIENCHVTKDVVVTSTATKSSAGGIVAYMHSGTPVVKNCSSQAMVTSTDSGAGGIVGFFAEGTVDNCMYLDNNIHVNETRYKKGAIAGYYGNGKATNCYYTSTDMKDNQGALMPDAEVDNTAFLTKLHERDEYMMDAGMPEELIGYDITLNNHELSSSLDKRKAYVVCLPFDMNITDIYGETDEISVYDMLKVDIDNNEFVFTNEFPILSAGKPYIVVIKAGTMMLTARNVLVTATPDEGRAVNETETESPAGLWQGTFKKMDNTELLNEKAYILQKSGVFRRTTQKNTGCYVDAFTGYFAAIENLTSKKFKVRFQRTENGVTEGDVTDFPADEFDYGFDLGDDETGVKEIQSTQYTVHSSDSFYTLDGRKISGKPANKGIYISNGIKVVE